MELARRVVTEKKTRNQNTIGAICGIKNKDFQRVRGLDNE